MKHQMQVLIDSPDTGDIPPRLLDPLVSELNSNLTEYEVRSAWVGASSAHAGDYWPELIIWVADKDNRELIADTVLITITATITNSVLKQTGKCVSK